MSAARTLGHPRALNLPRAARVRAESGTPYSVNGERIDSVRESWLVEDRWWTGCPLRRRYWEVVSVRGRNLVVFRDLCTGGWFTQAA
ncbi:MAG TPA: hypothetical protein VK701_04060 [Solirubrobacteraceae bacterium]|jgi:hypothetical protein|nr:hypothetical protein [Solirubrobacteraceae bacterium]